MRLSPIGAGFYSANRTVFRGSETKPKQVQFTILTEEAKKDPKAVMKQLLTRTGNDGKKLAAFDFCKARHSRTSGGYISFDTYSVESVDNAKREDVAGAIFEIVVNSGLPKEDRLKLLKTIVSEDIFREGETKAGLYSKETGCIEYGPRLNLSAYFAQRGKNLDQVAKELGATEKLIPNKKLAHNNEHFSPRSSEQHWGAGNYDFLDDYNW